MVGVPLQIYGALIGLACLACLCLAACAKSEPTADNASPATSNTPASEFSYIHSDTENLARQFQTVEGGSEFAQTDGALITVRPRDTIPAILSPALSPVSEASEWMEADELVLGIEIDGDARAYPIRVLSRHEIVNDVVAETPVAVTW